MKTDIHKSITQGLITLWNVDDGLPQIDKYLYSTDNHVVAGALLGVGILNCGIRSECDPVRQNIHFNEHI